MFSWLRKRPALDSYASSLQRDVLIQAGRILFVDDEEIPLIDQLIRSGFSVSHDKTGSDFEPQVVNQTYDVAILDHTGVGSKYGPNQGLDLLKFIRRVSPRTRVIAYTSRALKSGESDFYRLADRVLAKDAGMRESLECVEEQLQMAFSKQHLFDALMKKLEVSSGADRLKLKAVLEKSLQEKDQTKFRAALKKVAGTVAEKGVDIVLNKLFVDSGA